MDTKRLVVRFLDGREAALATGIYMDLPANLTKEEFRKRVADEVSKEWDRYAQHEVYSGLGLIAPPA